jgi:HSP20 family protein
MNENQVSTREGTRNGAGVGQGDTHSPQAVTLLPRVDIREGNDALALIIDLPGVTESGLDIHFEKSTLTITGQVDVPRMDGMRLACAECAATPGQRTQYRRRFTLSDAFDHEAIAAALKDGVLTLRIPKSSRQRARKIPITIG